MRRSGMSHRNPRSSLPTLGVVFILLCVTLIVTKFDINSISRFINEYFSNQDGLDDTLEMDLDLDLDLDIVPLPDLQQELYPVPVDKNVHVQDTQQERGAPEVCANKAYRELDISAMDAYRQKCRTDRLTKLPREDLSTREGTPINLSIMVKHPLASPAQCPRILSLATLPMPKTGLVTFPGSGGVWARHLIQQLTGIHTGSVYRSHSNGTMTMTFPYEGQVSSVNAPPFLDGSQVIEYEDGSRLPVSFDQLLLILRNPYDAIRDEFDGNRLSNEGISDTWEEHFERRTNYWGLFVQSVLKTRLPLLVIFYEDLASCPLPELVKMAAFLRSKNTDEFSFCCTLKGPQPTFLKRAESSNNAMVGYSDEEIRILNDAIVEVASLIETLHPSVSKRIYQYL